MVTPVWKNPGEHLLFANWAYVHVCRFRGCGEGQVKGVGSRVHLKEIKEGKSEMMAGGAKMNFVSEITYIL